MAIVGVSDHCGWAIAMTVGAGNAVLDRRRIELVAADLPSLPYHHDAQMLSTDEGVELVERVTASAKQHARVARADITGIAIRRCPELPATDDAGTARTMECVNN